MYCGLYMRQAGKAVGLNLNAQAVTCPCQPVATMLVTLHHCSVSVSKSTGSKSKAELQSRHIDTTSKHIFHLNIMSDFIFHIPNFTSKRGEYPIAWTRRVKNWRMWLHRSTINVCISDLVVYRAIIPSWDQKEHISLTWLQNVISNQMH